MRVDEDGGVEESATVAAYDWLDGWGGTSSSSESSGFSADSSTLSNNLEFTTGNLGIIHWEKKSYTYFIHQFFK